MQYLPPDFKYPVVSSNIQLTLHEHLPIEHQAVIDKISSLTAQLAELQAYKAYLEKIAEACEIRIVVD